MKAHIPAFAMPAFLEFVSAHAAKGDPDAERLMAKLPRKGKGRPGLAPGRTRAERAAEHRASTGDLRAQAFERSAHGCACGTGHCEACGVDLGESWELHHIDGAGHRRSRQRLGNVLCLCWECHRRAHRGDLGTLTQIAQAPTLDAEARKEAKHRIDKIEEARRG